MEGQGSGVFMKAETLELSWEFHYELFFPSDRGRREGWKRTQRGQQDVCLCLMSGEGSGLGACQEKDLGVIWSTPVVPTL